MNSPPRGLRPRAGDPRVRARRPPAGPPRAMATAVRCPVRVRPGRRPPPRPAPRSVTVRRPVPVLRPWARLRAARRRPPQARQPGRRPAPIPAHQPRPRRGPRFPRCPPTAARRPALLSLAAARCPARGPRARAPVARDLVVQDLVVQVRALRDRAPQGAVPRDRVPRARAARDRVLPGLVLPGLLAAVARDPARAPVTTPMLRSPPAWAPPRVARRHGRASPARAAPVPRRRARVVHAPAGRVRPARVSRDGPAQRTWPVLAGRVPAPAACRRGPPVVVPAAVLAVRAVVVPAAAPARADARAAAAVAVPVRARPVPVAVAAVPAHARV
jgi:hypothetical protein